jgi:hypothetical protein
MAQTPTMKRYSFRGSDLDVNKEHLLEGKEFVDVDAAIEFAQDLIDEWGCEAIDIWEGEEFAAQVAVDEDAEEDDTGELEALDESDEDEDIIDYFFCIPGEETDPNAERSYVATLPAFDEAIDLAERLRKEWSAECVDVYADDELVARVTPDGVLMDEDLDDGVTYYCFYASEEDTDEDHCEEDAEFPSRDEAVERAKALRQTWGCEFVEVFEDDVLVAVVKADRVINEDELAELEE